jgi:hypothetical protein
MCHNFAIVLASLPILFFWRRIMKKTLLRIAFIIVALGLSSKAFIALFAYQAIESFKDLRSQEFALTYNWIESSLKGRLSFEGLEVRPYALKRSGQISRVTLDYGSYLRLLMSLPRLKAGELDGLKSIVVEGAVMPLEGRDLEEWLAFEYGDQWLSPLGLYACGVKTRVDKDVLNEMSIETLRADVQLERVSAESDAEAGWSAQVKLYELGYLELDVKGLSIGPRVEGGNQIESLSASYLRLKHIDAGYLRRLSNYCETVSSLNRDDFALAAADRWSQELLKNGIQVNVPLVDAYRDYLNFGGAIELEYRAQTNATAGEIFRTYDRNLVEHFELKLSLNDKTIKPAFIALKKQLIDPDKSAQPIKQSAKPVQETATWLPLTSRELDAAVGYSLKVKLQSGKRFEGTLKSVDEFQFELNQLVDGGQLAYLIKREEVAEMLVKRKPSEQLMPPEELLPPKELLPAEPSLLTEAPSLTEPSLPEASSLPPVQEQPLELDSEPVASGEGLPLTELQSGELEQSAEAAQAEDKIPPSDNVAVDGVAAESAAVADDEVSSGEVSPLDQAQEPGEAEISGEALP